jgi:hypothetical protein
VFEQLKQIFLQANSEGIPLPLLRDNKTGKGSYTLTMFWMSFNLSILLLAGKITKLVGDVEYSNVLWLLGITGGMYLGRRTQESKTGVVVEGSENDEK